MNIPKNLRIASETSMEDRAIVTDAERERVLAGLAILASGVRRMQELDEADDRNSLRLCRAVDGLRMERAACEAARSAA